MFNDAKKLLEIQETWKGIWELRSRLIRTTAAATAFGSMPGIFPWVVADAAHNVPFLHAFSVLQDALQLLRDEGRFKCENKKGDPIQALGTLLKCSKDYLDWQDYNTIAKARCKRNRLAHESIFLPRKECWEYIDAIEQEFLAWDILKEPSPEIK